MMNYHRERVTPVQIPTSVKNAFDIPANEFEKTIKKYKLDAYLISNPCNPTGNVIEGNDLRSYVQAGTKNNCTLIFDEFYSHFIFEKEKPGKGPVSAAAYVDDVNKSPVILIDGLTKSFRYPGWRIGWAIGPKNMIENLNRAASAIDGGPSQPMTRAALKVLDKNYADKETSALRKVFSKKRNMMVEALTNAGIEFLPQAKGTFYLWGNISNLPKPINRAEQFFFEALKYKVMTVPGYFFDIQPGQNKKVKSDFDKWVRFSFGPPEGNMVTGLERLTKMIQSFSKKKIIKK
jgi:aspartate/methionine/tyrosine aminotransferase